MKRLSVLFLMLILLFSMSSCTTHKAQEPTTLATPTTVVNNIYITDEGIFTDLGDSQNESASQAPASSPQTEPATTAIVVTTTEPTQLPLSQYTAQMVLEQIITAVNFAKSQTDFSAHLLQQVEIRLTDCTFSWAVPIINGAISVFNGPHDFDYSFVNGSCSDPKEDFKTTTTPMAAIPPSDRLFGLEADGIAEYKSYEENGEYVYSVTLPFEFTDSETLVPYYHAQAMDYLDLGDFDFGIGEITDSECNYPGATVTVRTDKSGRLLKYEETIPMFGSGTGRLGIELSASFEGSMYECWTFEW